MTRLGHDMSVKVQIHDSGERYGGYVPNSFKDSSLLVQPDTFMRQSESFIYHLLVPVKNCKPPLLRLLKCKPPQNEVNTV